MNNRGYLESDRSSINKAAATGDTTSLMHYICELEALLREIDYHTWRGVDIVSYTYAIPTELIQQIKPLISDTDDTTDV